MKAIQSFLGKFFSGVQLALVIIVALTLFVTLLASQVFNLLTFETMVSIALGALVSFFVLESLLQHYSIVPLIKDIKNLEALEKFEIIETQEEYYAKLLNAIDGARSSVQLIYLTPHPPNQYGKNSLSYWRDLEVLIKRKNSPTVQRIASIDNVPKKNWIREDSRRLAKVKCYSLKCFSQTGKFRFLGMEIIDKRDVFLFGPHSGQRCMRVKSREFGELMSAHFDSVWDSLGEDSYVKKYGEKNPEIDSRMDNIYFRQD